MIHRRAAREAQGQGQQGQQGAEGMNNMAISEQEERHLAMLDRGFMPSTQLFAVRVWSSCCWLCVCVRVFCWGV